LFCHPIVDLDQNTAGLGTNDRVDTWRSIMLEDKTAVVTGMTGGIGLGTARGAATRKKQVSNTLLLFDRLVGLC
jgi:hypothetical protein